MTKNTKKKMTEFRPVFTDCVLSRVIEFTGSKCLRPGSGAFFKEKCLLVVFLTTTMALKRNLAHGQISPSLTF